MWWRRQAVATALAAATALAGCTAQPLYSSSVAPAAVASGAAGGGVTGALASVYVQPVTTRAAQQVRNELIFLMSAGRGNPDGAPYTLRLSASPSAASSTVRNVTAEEQAATAQIITFVGTYTLTDSATGQVLGRGQRRATAAFDNPRQPFAEQRALRDAQDRSARELAALLAAAVAADLATGRSVGAVAQPLAPAPRDEPVASDDAED